MLRVGLTGSIATGKSTILAQIAGQGAPVYSADEAVYALYEGDAVPQIEMLFPGVAVDGRIDRARLSAALAAEPARVDELESVVHPLVFDRAIAFLDAAEQGGAELAVLEIPLLFETGRRYPLDAVITAYCSETIQRQRALDRPGMTGEKLDVILARQMPQAEKRARADFAIDTSISLADTQRQVDAVLAALRRTAIQGPAPTQGGSDP